MRYARASVTGLVVLAVAVIVTACTTASSGAGSRRAGSDVIGEAELEPHLEEDLLTFIQRARPNWLQTRPARAQGANDIVVVIDGVPQEAGLDPLRGLKVRDVQEARRLSASDATTRFGTGMTAGAILVVTKH